jgi:hypothetical protein
MKWCTTMTHPGASAVGSVLGSGVGAHDVFHWERILALYPASQRSNINCINTFVIDGDDKAHT